MYKDYVDPEFTWANFTVEEQAKVCWAFWSDALRQSKATQSEVAMLKILPRNGLGVLFPGVAACISLPL